jgi:hypothetical protein
MGDLRKSIGATGIGIIILTLITAIIHLSLGQPLFILNGLGYLAIMVGYYLPALAKWHRWIRWLFIGYTVLTIVLYFVFHADGSWQQDGLGIVTKMVEIVLVLLLLLDRRGSAE